MKHKNWLLVVFFGSIWGFFEATLGGFLHMFHLPLTGQIMSGIGIGIMFWAVRSGVKPSQIILLSIVAASFKFADVFLFSLPTFDIKIINPAQAIMMEGLAFAFISSVYKEFGRSLAGKILPSVIVLSVSMVLFNLVSYFLFGFSKTQHLENIAATFFLHLPFGTIVATASLYIVDGLNSLKISTLRPAWQAGLTACLAVIAVVFKMFAH